MYRFIDQEWWDVKRCYTKKHIHAQHRLAYYKRRKMKSQYKYTGFKPYCSCGWQDTIWYDTLPEAVKSHTSHLVLSVHLDRQSVGRLF